MVVVRKEGPQDTAAITRIDTEAFAGPAEAHLVETLRQNEKITLSLVALVIEQMVGHILFSAVQIVSPAGETHNAVGLGPVAVLPTYQ